MAGGGVASTFSKTPDELKDSISESATMATRIERFIENVDVKD